MDFACRDSPHNYAKIGPFPLGLFTAARVIGTQSAWLWPGGYVRTSRSRTAPMFDTALLIASALGVALMVAFSDLP